MTGYMFTDACAAAARPSSEEPYVSRVVDEATLAQAVELALQKHLKTADMPARELTRVRAELQAHVDAAAHEAARGEGEFLQMLADAIDDVVAAIEARDVGSAP